MFMVRIRISQLDEAVKAFLAPAQQGETIVVEDDDGRLQCGVTPYVQVSAAEKQAALEKLQQLRHKTNQAMDRQGIEETDIDRELRD